MIEKQRRLREILAEFRKVLVAFSGGTDSSLVLKLCVDTLGADGVLAVTASSESYTSGELAHAVEFARGLGVEHVVLRTEELSNPDFAANTPRRCYHCKCEFYDEVLKLAAARNILHVLDGSNVDDQGDYRPGREAAFEHGVRSPLIDAGLGKAEVRALSKQLGLTTWDKPANPCLASRFPYGEAITADKLSMVEKAEALLQSRGFQGGRVRHHGSLARIEAAPEHIAALMETRTREWLSAELKALGFTWVAMDLDGYRTGSLNEALPSSDRRRVI